MTSRSWRGRRAPLRLGAALVLVVAVLTAGAAAPALDVPPGGAGTSQPPDPYYPDLGNRGYDVEHYDLGLDYEPSNQHVDGDATIDATATERLRKFHLDLFGMEVQSVAVDGKPARYRREGAELIVRPRTPIKADKAFEVRVKYSGTPGASEIPGLGAANGWLPTDDGVITLNEPDGARTWFPANDHPTDKASYTFRLDVPQPLTAVANGELESRVDEGDRTVWTWDEAAPMATYLAQLAIGNLAVEDAPAVDGVTIRNAFAPGVHDAAAAAAARTPEMLAFFSSWFGKYPFSTYGIIAPDSGLEGLAFEAQTFSLFAPDVFRNASQASSVLAHELVHQWFGDWLTPSSWDDTWLNEGFATYFEWLWGEAALSSPLQRNIDDAYEQATLDPDAAAADPGRDEMFSAAVYNRGALVVHALRLTVGEDAFVRILRTYLERFGGRTASTADLIGVASEIAGSNLTELFTAWLGPGAPPPLPAGTVGSTPPNVV